MPLFRPLSSPIVIPTVNTFTALTGGTSETILGYANIPGLLLGLTGSIEVDASFLVTGANGSWVNHMRIIAGTSAGTLAGTALMGLTTSAGNRVRYQTKIANFNSLSAQRTGQFGPSSFAQTSNGFASSTIDTASPFTISMNAAIANAADSLELLHWSVVLKP